MSSGVSNDSMFVSLGKTMWNNNNRLSLYSQRLSTGLRINSAKDDAANLGISEKLQSNLKATDILKNNASTGVDALKTVDGDLGQVTNLLQRMRDLTVQGLNGVYSASEQAMMMNEVNQLGAEVKRITQSSVFADKKLLDSTANANDPLKIYVNDHGSENYIDLSNIAKNMLFADVIAKDANVYMLPMTPAQTSYVEFNNKLYQINNTSATNKNLIYGYEEDLVNENNSVTLVDDSAGVTKSFVGAYQNDQVQMGNGEIYLNVAGGQTLNFTVGTNVFSLTNSDAAQQTAVFKTVGAALNMVSGQSVSGSFQYGLSAYNSAAGTESAIALNGGEQKYINYAGKLYSVTNNSGTEETFVYRNNAGNLQGLSGNVTTANVGTIATPTNLGVTDRYETLNASQELFYDNGGTIYSLKNNTAQAQMVELSAANNIINPNTSVTKSALSTITGATGMTNPYAIDAVAGQKYYVRSNDNSTIHELTASATGTLLIDFDGANINSIGGVGAAKTTTTAPDYENVTPDGSQKFTIDISANQQEAITIGNEVYKISNTSGITSTVTFNYDALTKSLSLDMPNANITLDGYQGDLATKNVLGPNDYYVPSLAAGASTYIKTGTDIFKITNSSGTSINSTFNYNAGAHTLTSTTAGMASTLETQPTFTNNTASDKGLRLTGGQTQLVQFGSDYFEIKNNTANEQSIVFAYNAGNITVNDAGIAASLTITKHVSSAQTALAAGDVYTTLTAGGSKNLSVANRYFEIDNTSGARTALFRRAGNTLTQRAGTGVNNTYNGAESFETTSTTSDYYIEMNGGEQQYIKVGSYAYNMNNTTGTSKTDVFRQVGSNLVSQNPNITELNMPISNQSNFSQLMPIIDWALGTVSDKRSEIGSKMKALEETMEMKFSDGISLTSANSVIRDTDMAKERSNYVKDSILRDYSVNMFKQFKDMSGSLALTLLM